ncbi:ankyrin repeat domain-containing protein [Streptomyces sp. NBC_00510]
MSEADLASQWLPENEWTPAHLAVELSDHGELSRLLADGTDPDEVCLGQSLLIHAIDLEGDSAIQSGEPLTCVATAILLAYGADPAFADPEGYTPLEMAKKVNHVMAEDLLRAFVKKRHRRPNSWFPWARFLSADADTDRR